MIEKIFNRSYENYPFRIILVSNIIALSIYIIGASIVFQIGLVRFILYILYILFLEFRLLKKSCTHCYYYDKYCAFGKGKLCALFFSKGDPKEFLKRKITFKAIIPEFLVSIIPILIGVVLIIINFNRWILIGIIVIIVLTSQGNGCVRWQLACKYCKQKKIGCPAAQLFNKMKK